MVNPRSKKALPQRSGTPNPEPVRCKWPLVTFAAKIVQDALGIESSQFLPEWVAFDGKLTALGSGADAGVRS